MLTVDHIRNKRSYDLSTSKFADRMRQSAIHPRDFTELTKLLNLHSRKDVSALAELDFFRINSKSTLEIARTLIPTLLDHINDYYVNSLPPQMRQPFLDAIKNLSE